MPHRGLWRAPHRRLRLEPAGDLRSFSPKGRLGAPALLVPAIASTNATLKVLARAGFPEGTLISADLQTRGRGRLGRAWQTPPAKALLASVLLRPQGRVEAVQLATLLWGVAVVQAVRSLTGLEAGLKWPNDVMVRGCKVCGILAESASSGRGVAWIVVGFGMNVHQLSFPKDLSGATSLAAEGKSASRAQLLEQILLCAEPLYAAWLEGDVGEVLRPYRALSDTLGKDITWHQGEEEISGCATGIDELGRLVVATATGTRTLWSGEVTSHRREAPGP